MHTAQKSKLLPLAYGINKVDANSELQLVGKKQ